VDGRATSQRDANLPLSDTDEANGHDKGRKCSGIAKSIQIAIMEYKCMIFLTTYISRHYKPAVSSGHIEMFAS